MRTSPLPAWLAGRPFAVDEARRLGVADKRMRAKDLTSPFHGVRALSGDALSLPERCRAYRAAADVRSVFSHTTAARLWNLPLPVRFERDAELHVLILGGENPPRHRGVVGHTGAPSTPTAVIDGLPVTGAVETWCALAAILSLDDLIVAGDRLLDWREPLAGPKELELAVASMAGRRGVRAARAALQEIRARSRSPRETRCRLALVRAGLPEPELNAQITLPGGFMIHGDLVYRAQRVLIEYESAAHRLDDAQWMHDLGRYNALSEAGWTVVRVSKGMPESKLVATVRRLLSRP